jgi:hypothetical protein
MALKEEYEKRLRSEFQQRFYGVKCTYKSVKDLSNVDSKQEIEDFWIKKIEEAYKEMLNAIAEAHGLNARVD